MRPLILSLLVTTAMSAAAVAQTSQTNQAKPATPAASTAPASSNASSTASSSNMGGMQMVDEAKPGMKTARAATVAVQFVALKPTDTVTSRLIGTDVYNNQNEMIGEIEDFVLVDGKTIHAVVLGVGGFLGLGERYVAVQPSAIMLAREGNSFRAMMDTNKEQLTNAPKFDYSRRVKS